LMRASKGPQGSRSKPSASQKAALHKLRFVARLNITSVLVD
jgi:hypothetical protein